MHIERNPQNANTEITLWGSYMYSSPNAHLYYEANFNRLSTIGQPSRKNENYSCVKYCKIPLVASSCLPSVTFEWYFPWKKHLFCMKSEGRALPTEWISCLLRLLWPTCAYFMRTDNTVNFQQAHLLGRDCCLSRMQFFQKPKRRRTFWVKQLPCY